MMLPPTAEQAGSPVIGPDQLLWQRLACWPLLVLIASFVLTGVLWQMAREEADRDLGEHFEHDVADIAGRIEAEFSTQEVILKGLQGLFSATDQVTRGDFRRYFETLHFGAKDHGFAGLAYHELVPAKDLARHLARMKQEGFPDYRIAPEGERELYAPMVYIEPMSAANKLALGFDPYALDVERRAVERARDTGRVSISSKLTLAQDVGTNVPGFVMYAPIYRGGVVPGSEAARRASFVGWVDAPFRMATLMSHINPGSMRDIDFEIFDGPTKSSDGLFFDSDATPHAEGSASSRFNSQRQVEFAGKVWMLVFHSRAGYGDAAIRQKPQFVATVGILLGILLSLSVAQVIRAQRRRVSAALLREAEAHAQERRQADMLIRESEQHFRTLANGGSMLIWTSGLDKLCNYFNEPWLRFTGRTLEQEVGNGWTEGLHPDDYDFCVETYVASFDRRKAFSIDYRIRHADGSYHWIRDDGNPRYDSEGQFLGYIGFCMDITERKLAAEQIEQLAFYDPLTRLPNRRLMLDRLDQALISCVRRRRHGALMLIDLDNFKVLNDTQGHDVGDQLLVEVASRLESCIREGDTVARLGGDEFVVILKDLDESELAATQAENVAEKIQSLLRQPYLLNLSSNGQDLRRHSHSCTSSIGITLFRDQTVSIDELLRRADTAMYQAKAANRNSLRFFDPAMQEAVDARAAIEVDLRKAIVERQFLLHYQAQVNSSGQVVGAEALGRWQHPERGLVFPGDFIPLAEETGLILPLGHQVLAIACAQLATWAGQPEMAHLTLAVNVSARQFSLPNFVEEVLGLVDSTGAPADKLKLELTESLLVENTEGIISKMAALKASGIGFSLDDFGTGYSSLSYLKRLPLDQLKIDQSFVRDVLSDANDAAIAKTVVALGQALGLAVIAEGVETEAQRDFLAESGCHAYQGYFFSRPLPLEGFEAFVTGSIRKSAPLQSSALA